MDLNIALKQLRAEKNALDETIAALESLVRKQQGTPKPKSTNGASSAKTAGRKRRAV